MYDIRIKSNHLNHSLGVPGKLIGLYGIFYGIGAIVNVFFDWNNYLRVSKKMELKTMILLLNSFLILLSSGQSHGLIFIIVPQEARCSIKEWTRKYKLKL